MAFTQFSSGVTDAQQRVGADPVEPAFLSLAGRQVHAVGSARLYVCGITPYDVAHIGHASTFVWADLLATVLSAGSVRPRMCRNVTDVDDVLTYAARERGWPYDEFALTQEASFERSMAALRVSAPGDQPHARHHIHAVIQLAQALLNQDAAYERHGTVWFRGQDVVTSASLTPEAARALLEQHGESPGDDAKDSPFDVPVWRPSDDGSPAWQSPWGWGRPGWHAECAAMAMTVHGCAVDVLVGGEDLTFPHHAYQAAMVEAVSRVSPFARATLHVGEVRRDEVKMAKSTGNLVLVDDLLSSRSPAAVRLMLLSRRYADAWDFDEAQLTDAEDRLNRLYSAAARRSDEDPEAVLHALRADLDVLGALALAEEHGGEVARRAIALLKVG